MIYTNLDKILTDTGIENKYALAMIVTTRARQLSERRDSDIYAASSEMCITRSINEIQDRDLSISSPLGPVTPE